MWLKNIYLFIFFFFCDFSKMYLFIFLFSFSNIILLNLFITQTLLLSPVPLVPTYLPFLLLHQHKHKHSKRHSVPSPYVMPICLCLSFLSVVCYTCLVSHIVPVMSFTCFMPASLITKKHASRLYFVIDSSSQNIFVKIFREHNQWYALSADWIVGESNQNSVSPDSFYSDSYHASFPMNDIYFLILSKKL